MPYADSHGRAASRDQMPGMANRCPTPAVPVQVPTPAETRNRQSSRYRAARPPFEHFGNVSIAGGSGVVGRHGIEPGSDSDSFALLTLSDT